MASPADKVHIHSMGDAMRMRSAPVARESPGLPVTKRSSALPAGALERVIGDPARLTRLHATGLLDTPPEVQFDRFTRLAATIVHAPTALVSLVDGDRDFWKSCLGVAEPFASAREIRIGPSFCQHTVFRATPLVVRDALADPTFASLPAVAELGVRAYIGVPLATADGVALGTLCVLDYAPRDWQSAQVECMIDLAAAVMTEVGLRTAVRELERASEETEASRSRLSAILEGMNDGYIALDREWRVTALNQSALRIDGRAIHDLIGNNHWDLWPNTAGTRVEEEYRRVMATGSAAHFEHHYDDPTRDLWHEIDAYRTPDGIACFYRDITKRRRALVAARHAQRIAESANRAKSEFVAQMSHELRTPLNAIMGYAELMQLGVRGPVTEGQAQDLTRIQRAAKSLTMIISDILNFARVEAGHLALDMRTVDVSDVVAAAGALIAPQATAREIDFTTAPMHEQIEARADRERLQQIVLNLLTNAVKYNHAGGFIHVTCEASGAMALVHVGDTGPGIPADTAESIFDPFVQLGRTTSSPVEGVGLGLSISRMLARSMGGDVTVTSKIGEGSVFTVSIPRSSTPESPAPILPAS